MSLEQEIGGMAADLLTALEDAGYGDNSHLEVGAITVAVSYDRPSGGRGVGYHQVIAGSGPVFQHQANGLLVQGLDLVADMGRDARIDE